MISLHCTQCQQLLEMDEAFAGGVCRCQYCGTIQTVPSKKKPGSGKSSSGKSSTSKALYKKGSASAPGGPPESSLGTGLDELAEIVASSGLARGSLTKPPRQVDRTSESTAEGVPAPKSNTMLPLLIGAGVVIVVLIGVVVYMAMRPSSAPPSSESLAKSVGGVSVETPTTPDHTGPPDKSAPAGPSFAGVSLPEGDVAFLLDRSQSNDQSLDAVKAATYRAARSLGDGRKFQILFWHRQDEGIVAYPEDALAAASKAEVLKASKRFEDVVSYGTTNLKPTLEKALKSNPGTIVIVTAKGVNLEEADVAAVEAATKDHPVTIDTISIGESESPVLKQIAQKTGGEYHALSETKLRGFAQ